MNKLALQESLVDFFDEGRSRKVGEEDNDAENVSVVADKKMPSPNPTSKAAKEEMNNGEDANVESENQGNGGRDELGVNIDASTEEVSDSSSDGFVSRGSVSVDGMSNGESSRRHPAINCKPDKGGAGDFKNGSLVNNTGQSDGSDDTDDVVEDSDDSDTNDDEYITLSPGIASTMASQQGFENTGTFEVYGQDSSSTTSEAGEDSLPEYEEDFDEDEECEGGEEERADEQEEQYSEDDSYSTDSFEEAKDGSDGSSSEDEDNANYETVAKEGVSAARSVQSSDPEASKGCFRTDVMRRMDSPRPGAAKFSGIKLKVGEALQGRPGALKRDGKNIKLANNVPDSKAKKQTKGLKKTVKSQPQSKLADLQKFSPHPEFSPQPLWFQKSRRTAKPSHSMNDKDAELPALRKTPGSKGGSSEQVRDGTCRRHPGSSKTEGGNKLTCKHRPNLASIEKTHRDKGKKATAQYPLEGARNDQNVFNKGKSVLPGIKSTRKQHGSPPRNKPDVLTSSRQLKPHVPISLRSSAIFQNGQVDVSIHAHEKLYRSSRPVQVNICLVPQRLPPMKTSKRDTSKVKKKVVQWGFDGVNRDVIHQRAQFPPFNTHVNQEASRRHQMLFGDFQTL